MMVSILPGAIKIRRMYYFIIREVSNLMSYSKKIGTIHWLIYTRIVKSNLSILTPYWSATCSKEKTLSLSIKDIHSFGQETPSLILNQIQRRNTKSQSLMVIRLQTYLILSSMIFHRERQLGHLPGLSW